MLRINNEDYHEEDSLMRKDKCEEVNAPSHYNSNTVETIDLIRDSMESDE